MFSPCVQDYTVKKLLKLTERNSDKENEKSIIYKTLYGLIGLNTVLIPGVRGGNNDVIDIGEVVTKDVAISWKAVLTPTC